MSTSNGNGQPESNGRAPKKAKRKATKKKAAPKKTISTIKPKHSGGQMKARRKKQLKEAAAEAGVAIPEKQRDPRFVREYDDSPIVREYKHGRCTANSKQTVKKDGTPGRCRRPAGPEGVCYYHGGKPFTNASQKPAMHDGDSRWSRSLGDKVGMAYEAALDDDDLVNLKRGLATLDVVVQKAMQRMDENDTIDWREAVAAKVRELTSAAYLDAAAKAVEKELDELLHRGLEHDRSMDRLVDTVTRFQQGVEKFWAIQIRGHETMTTAQVGAMFRRMIGVLLRVYGDDAERGIVEIDRECMGGRLSLANTEAARTGTEDD